MKHTQCTLVMQHTQWFTLHIRISMCISHVKCIICFRFYGMYNIIFSFIPLTLMLHKVSMYSLEHRAAHALGHLHISCISRALWDSYHALCKNTIPCYYSNTYFNQVRNMHSDLDIEEEAKQDTGYYNTSLHYDNHRHNNTNDCGK